MNDKVCVLILPGLHQELVLEITFRNKKNTELIVDGQFKMDVCAISPLQPAAENICHIRSCQNAYQKEREEKKLYSIPNCLQNEASHRAPLLSSVEFARRSRLDLKESAGLNASIGSCGRTERCAAGIQHFALGEHDSLIKYSYRQHHK